MHNAAKPGRPARPDTWVAHAASDWSRVHLEELREEALARLASAFAAAVPGDLPDPLYAAAHRWRFARVETPLGQPCLEAMGGRLVLGGDWALGPDAADAWASGRAMARAVL